MDRIEKLKEFLIASPQDSFLRHALALEYIKAGADNEARMLLEGLLADDEKYVGSYYHLAKLMERLKEPERAGYWYEKGMTMAKQCGDRHAYNELQAAYEDLTDG
jgi:Tfp pilus assembly protein PilF